MIKFLKDTKNGVNVSLSFSRGSVDTENNDATMCWSWRLAGESHTSFKQITPITLITLITLISLIPLIIRVFRFAGSRNWSDWVWCYWSHPRWKWWCACTWSELESVMAECASFLHPQVSCIVLRVLSRRFYVLNVQSMRVILF